MKLLVFLSRTHQTQPRACLSVCTDFLQTTPPLADVLVLSYLPATSDFFPAFVSAVDKEGTVWLQQVEGADPASLDSLVDTMTSDYSKVGAQVMKSLHHCISECHLALLLAGAGTPRAP